MSSSYLIIYFITKNLQNKLGENYVKMNSRRYFVISEIFSGIKDVKLNSLEKFSIDRFYKPSLSYAKDIALSLTLSSFPKFFVEALAFGGIILFFDFHDAKWYKH